MESYLIGRKWKTELRHIDNFPVLSFDLELARWKGNEDLHKFITENINQFEPSFPIKLTQDDIEKIIEALTIRPRTIYGQEGIVSQSKIDLEKFIKAKDWLTFSFPYGSVLYDVF